MIDDDDIVERLGRAVVSERAPALLQLEPFELLTIVEDARTEIVLLRRQAMPADDRKAFLQRFPKHRSPWPRRLSSRWDARGQRIADHIRNTHEG